MITDKSLLSTKCPLCGRDSFKILYKSTLTKKDFNPKVIQVNLKNTLSNYKKHARIVRCSQCNLVYTNPMENFSQLLKGYEEVVDEEYLKTEKYRKILSKQHLKIIEKYIKNGKMLDVGSFAGYFLELAKKEGWDIYGIEPSKWASLIAKKRGVKLIGQDILSIEMKKNYFDVVTMWDVIEHLPQPHRVLSNIYSVLKPGGLIVIGTPDIESLFAKSLGSNCPHLLRMHIILYSPKTLDMLLQRHGFRIIDKSYYGRTFPVWYLIDRLQIKNYMIKKVFTVIKKISFLSNFSITVNFHDSLRLVAQKL